MCFLRHKNIALGFLSIAIGLFLIYSGVVSGTLSFINLGIAGVFVGIVILSFIPSKLIDYEIFESSLKPYILFFEKLTRSLHLSNKIIYIPPYENLPKGGIFIPADDRFKINIGNFDENVVLITSAGRSKEMGLLITPPFGYHLEEKFEEKTKLAGTDLSLVTSIALSVLKSYELIENLELEENDDEIMLTVEGIKLVYCNDTCEKQICPICSSILYAIAKSQNQMMLVENFKRDENSIKITIKKLGELYNYL